MSEVPPFEEGNDVIKMQLVLCFTSSAFSTFSFPHLEFNCSWNYPASLSAHVNWLSEVLVTFHRNQLKLVNNSFLIVLLPGINEVKDPVV